MPWIKRHQKADGTINVERVCGMVREKLTEIKAKEAEAAHKAATSTHKDAYNEDRLRREFIGPFFEELGRDVTNETGYPQAYKDVIHEDAIKIGGDVRFSAEKTIIQRQINNTNKQINNTNKQIDKLVYYLYNLTEEEIRIVEQNNNH